MRIEIIMEPVAKARARTVRLKDGRVISYTPDKTAHAENLIRDCAIQSAWKKYERPTPLFLSIIFCRSRSKSLPKRVKYPVMKPDLDNYAKLVKDALKGVVYDDDSQITKAQIEKRFTEDGKPPRIIVVVEEV